MPTCTEGKLSSGVECDFFTSSDPSAGAELVTYPRTEINCHPSGSAGCYGAPPARLERRRARPDLEVFTDVAASA